MAPATSSTSSTTNMTDDALAALARESKRAVDWDRILVLRSEETSSTQWKWVENARNFSIYTKKDSGSGVDPKSFSVLAVGNIKASVGELAALLTARDQSEYEAKAAALYGKDWKDGEYLYDVEYAPVLAEPTPSQLSVRTAMLAQGSWFSRDEMMCHLDAIYHDQRTGCFEKLLTMLRPQDVVPKDRFATSSFATYHNALSCYRIEPLEDHAVDEIKAPAPHKQSSTARTSLRPVSRVYYYASIRSSASTMPNLESLSLSSRSLSYAPTVDASEDKTLQKYLLHLAKNSDRLSTLIRRRRLGIQSLVDKKHFLSRTHTACFVCARKLLVAKICRVCGYGVCKDCSDKYERERRRSRNRNAKVSVERIRVCDPCLERVESADYSAISDASLAGPAVVPDTASAEAELGYLLREALARSPTPEHKRSVINVIKCVLDQEETMGDHSSSSSSVSLTDLHLDNIPYDQALHRSLEGRTYLLDTRNPETPLTAPISEQEDARVQAVCAVDIERLSDSVELSIICDLAVRELGCSMSTISIYDRENLNIVASNITAFQKARMPRWGTPCAHTILDASPNLVSHPEADIRYADSWVVAGHGVKFYFAFPIMGESDQVIGSFCVMNDRSVDVTESKYTAFKKLSDACNKVIRIHSQRCRNNSSRSTSTNASH